MPPHDNTFDSFLIFVRPIVYLAGLVHALNFTVFFGPGGGLFTYGLCWIGSLLSKYLEDEREMVWGGETRVICFIGVRWECVRA